VSTSAAAGRFPRHGTRRQSVVLALRRHYSASSRGPGTDPVVPVNVPPVWVGAGAYDAAESGIEWNSATFQRPATRRQIIVVGATI